LLSGGAAVLVGLGLLYCLDPHRPRRPPAALSPSGEVDPVRRAARKKYWGSVGGGAVGLAVAFLVVGGLTFWLREWSNRPALPTAVAEIQSGEKLSVVALSPDGGVLALGGEKGTIRLYRVTADGTQEKGILKGHDGRVAALAFTPDGRLLASAGADRTVRVWEAGDEPGERAVLRAHTEEVTGVAFTPDGKSLVSCSLDGTVRLWDASDGRFREQFPLPDWRYSVELLADGRTLAETNTTRDVLRLWDLGGAVPVERAAVPARRCCFSPDQRLLATVDPGGILHLWDMGGPVPQERAAGGLLRLCDPASAWPFAAPTFSSDGRWLAGGDQTGTVHLWDLTAIPPKEGPVLAGDGKPIVALSFSAEDKEPILRRVRFLQDVRFPECFEEEHFQLSRDGTRLTRRDPAHPLPRLADEPGPKDLPELAATADDTRVLVVKGGSGFARDWRKPSDAHPLGKPVLLAGDGGFVWEWRTPSEVRGVLVAPDGRHLITANPDGTIYVIRLWEQDPADRLLASSEAVLKHDPRNVPALLARGRAHLARGCLDLALRDADTALSIEDDNKEAGSLRALALYRRGLRHADEGRYAEAKSDLAEAVRLDPTLAPPAPGRKPRRRRGGRAA
jgi:WD40 repeat protein